MNPQPKAIEAIARHLSTNPHVEKVILFGSRARGDERERSDIDLAVVGPEITDGEWSAMQEYVEEDAPTLLMIDLVRLEKAGEHLRESIARDGVIVYERH